MDPGILGFGSIFSSMLDTAVSSSDRRAANELNYYATMDTNKTNANINAEQLAAARENWNREQQNFELQRKWALADRDYENWYNSPQHMRQMYLNAGINPALAMNGGTGVGTSGSSTKQPQAPQFGSPPSSIPMQAAHFDPVYNGGLGIGIQNAMNIMLAAERTESDIAVAKQKIDNETKETMTRISSAHIDDKYKTELINMLKGEIMFNRDAYASKLENLGLVNQQLQKQIAKIEFDQKLAESLNNSVIALNSKQRQVMDAQIRNYLQQIASMKNSDQLNSAEVSQRVISMINQDAALFEKLGFESELLGSQKFRNYVGSIVDAVGSAASIYFGVRHLGKGSFDVPNKPDSYLNNLNGYAPWSR